MTSATTMAWDACGRPAVPGATDVSGYCLVCGAAAGRLVPAKAALGKNFDLLTATRRDLDTVCEACAWALAGKPPNTLRMWSIVVAAQTQLPPSVDAIPPQYRGDGRLHLCNRGDQSAVISALTSPPADVWACTVAQSGQKHLLPYAPINAPGAATILVRFETATVEATPTVYAAVIGACAALRAAGHPADAIHTATPSVVALKGDGLTQWRIHAPTIAPHAHSPLLGLALHLITKETMHDLAHRYADTA